MWYMYTMEYFSAVKKKKKKNEIMPFCSNIDDLEIIVSEVSQRQISYDITYMWSLIKNDTKELNYKTETSSQISKSNYSYHRESHGREG